MQNEPEACRALLGRLASLLAAGKFDPRPTSTHRIVEVHDVLQSMFERRSVGKPVVQLDWR